MRFQFNNGWRVLALACLIAGGVSPAHSSVVVMGTRVIYPSDMREVSVRLTNNGEVPSLIQAWLDNGDPAASPESIKVPFILTPPLARIDPQKNQTLRMVYTGETLPQDKESLFWMNVLEIPPKPAAGTNSLQFAVRTRIKVFYRPKQLKGIVAEAGGLLEWTSSGTGSSTVIEARNPTPFYVSLVQVRLVAGEKEITKPVAVMIAPGASEKISFSDMSSSSAAPSAVRFQQIDDYGAFRDGEKRLSPK